MTASPHILIVDGDARFAQSLRERVAAWGYHADTAPDVDTALQRLADPRDRPQVLITDTHLPSARGAAGERGGDTLLRRLSTVAPGVVPLVLTGYGTIVDAVAAVKLGAADYLTKPLVDDALRRAIDAAVAQHALLAGPPEAESHDTSNLPAPRGMIGRDPASAALYRDIAAAADGAAPVLITGEPGTGKDLAARAIHAAGRAHRGGQLMVAPAQFDHAGALADLWSQAAGGTVLLRGIDRATPDQHAALLAWLQSDTANAADVRVIATAGPDVERVLSRPLLDRLAGVRLVAAALRDRPDDLDPLTDHLLKRACGRARRERTLGPPARRALAAYTWPGNVRELAHAIEHAVTLSTAAVIGPDDLPPAVTDDRPAADSRAPAAGPAEPSGAWVPMPLAEALLEPERRILIAALDANGWNRNAAARDLGIDRTTLYKKIKRFGLDRPDAAA